jgi:hypothetical protein
MKWLIWTLISSVISYIFWMVQITMGWKFWIKNKEHKSTSCRCSSPSCVTCAYCGKVWPCTEKRKKQLIQFSDSPSRKPTQDQPPNCVYPGWDSYDQVWVCCHGGINCGGCSTYPEDCINNT